VAADEDPGKDQSDLGARLGRAAGRFVKQARPRAKQLASDARPLVDKAAQYAAEHQDELKAAGTKVLRSRFAGSWGMAFDAVANATTKTAADQDAPSPGTCAKCGAENPKGSKFCNQCASPIDNG
jgi:zinc ribbon protein